VDHEVMWPILHLLGHEGPLEAGREARAAAAAQAGLLHLLDDRVGALVEDRLGVVPGAARAGAGQPPVVEAVKIREDPVLVGEHRHSPFSVVGPPTGAEVWRSICGPGLGVSPRRKPSSTRLVDW